MIHTINFNWKHLGRAMVCFALALCLMGNAFLTPVNASAIVYSTVAIRATLVVASIIIGLGVSEAPGSGSFSQLVNDTIAALNLGSVIDVVTWAASGFQKYAAPQSLVEKVRNYLFSSSTIKSEYQAPTASGYLLEVSPGTVFTYSSGDIVVGSSCYAMTYMGSSSTSRVLILASASGYPSHTYSGTKSDKCETYVYGGFYFKKIKYFDSWLEPNSGCYGGTITNYSDWQEFARAFADGSLVISPTYVPTVSQGFAAGTIAKETDDLAKGYTAWYANSVTVPGTITGTGEEDEEDVALPIAPGQTWGDTIGKTQDDVWNGNASRTEIDAGSSSSSISYFFTRSF